MKKSLTYLLMVVCGLLMFTSCSTDELDSNKVTYIQRYAIALNGVRSSSLNNSSPVLNELNEFVTEEISRASKEYGKDVWTIVVKAATMEEAEAEADRQAIEIFESLLPGLDVARDNVYYSFDNRRSQLSAGIAEEGEKFYVKILTLQGLLLKERKAPEAGYWDMFKNGTSVNLESIGGNNY